MQEKLQALSSHIRGMERKKLILACATVTLLACLTLLIGFLLMARPAAAPKDASPTVSITGTITCLPHRNKTGPMTLECAMGLHATNGTYYALRTSNASQTIDTFNKEVRVDGILTPPNTQEKYDIAGTIDVRSIELSP